jgi:hypothetical protein
LEGFWSWWYLWWAKGGCHGVQCLLACFLTKLTTPIPGVLRVGRDKIHRHPYLLGMGSTAQWLDTTTNTFKSKEGRKKQFGGEPAKWREERPWRRIRFCKRR